MSEETEVTVEYKRENSDRHTLLINSGALSEIKINYAGIPKEKRGGTSVRLLCATALYCFAATLDSALTVRGANIKSMSGQATAKKDKDDIMRTKVTEIIIEVGVEIDDEDEPILEKCKSIMDRGCLVTYSLQEAIEIEHTIIRL